MRMPFGRFRGTDLCNLPDGYIQWLWGLNLREPLRSKVWRQVSDRGLLDQVPATIEANLGAIQRKPCEP